MVAGHRDGGAVLAGDRHDTAHSLLVLHPVAKGRRKQIRWTDMALGIARRTESGRLDTIDLLPGLGIEPLVSDDAGSARVLSGEHRGVAGAGLGQAMRLIGTAVDD